MHIGAALTGSAAVVRVVVREDETISSEFAGEG